MTMRTINEIIDDEEFKNSHRIFEMSTLSRPSDNLPKSTKIVVYGENDEQGSKTPHFHLLIDNGKIHLEIAIKDIKKLSIYRTKHNYPKTWNGLRDVKIAVLNWLSKESKRPGVTNLQRLIDAWNDQNPSNEISDDYAG